MTGTAIILRDPGMPSPPAVRRKRRREVERRMLACQPSSMIWEKVAKRWHTLPRTVQRDMELIRTRWAKTDSDRSERILRRMERGAVALYGVSAKDAVDSDYKLARVLGMGSPTGAKTVNVDRRTTVITLGTNAPGAPSLAAWLAELHARLDARPVAVSVDALPAAPTSSNGAATNGHANGTP